MTSIERLLAAPDEIPQNHGVALSSTRHLTLSAHALVFDFDDLADDEDAPQQATDLGLETVLTRAEIEDVIENAKLQKSSASVDHLVEALKFYLSTDAFIHFDVG